MPLFIYVLPRLWQPIITDPEPMPDPINAPHQTTVAIIGAGIAGAACAKALRDAGIAVALIDKGRGAGGRLATRRITLGDGRQAQVDHGAQYFTARSEGFRTALAGWIAAGAAAPWPARLGTLAAGRFTPGAEAEMRYVGTPRMSALGSHMAGSAARYGQRVARLEKTGEGWRLLGEAGELLVQATQVVLAVPAPQVVELLASVAAPAMVAAVAGVETAPCWAVMLSFDGPLPLPFDGAFVEGSPLRWIARDAAKPGRPGTPETWVGHATPEWSVEHLEATPEAALPLLEAAFRSATGSDTAALHVAVHRWRYALASRPLGASHLRDAAAGLGVCGDWCLGPRVEAGWTSGTALGEEIAGSLRSDPS